MFSAQYPTFMPVLLFSRVFVTTSVFFSLLTKGSFSLEMHEGVCVDVSVFESMCPFFFLFIFPDKHASA